MIDGGHDLSIMRQAQLLHLSRSAVYYRPQPSSAADLALMRRIDALHLEHPFAGARMLRAVLCARILLPELRVDLDQGMPAADMF